MILECIRNVKSPLIPFFGYLITHKVFTKKYDKKIVQNLISFSHAFTSVTLNSLYLYTNNQSYFVLGKLISTGYFLFDIEYIWNKPNLQLLDFGFIYHHLASMYLIHLNLPSN